MESKAVVSLTNGKKAFGNNEVLKDISLTDKTISINKTVQRIYDKKKGESYLHIGPPKTKTSARTIPVPSLLIHYRKYIYGFHNA